MMVSLGDLLKDSNILFPVEFDTIRDEAKLFLTSIQMITLFSIYKIYEILYENTNITLFIS